MFTITSPDNWVDKSKLIYSPPTPTLLIFDNFTVYNPNSTNIYIQVEPNAVYQGLWNVDIRGFLLKYHTNFKYILTYDEVVLQKCPNAKRYVYGTTWLNPTEYASIDVSKKEYRISSITGSKGYTPGHKFRTNLYMKQAKTPIPSVYVRSRVGNIPEIGQNPTLGDSKFPLFETFQFSFVIENSRQANYFTEKLMDCLLSKTIPVYYGCPNIAEYFDTRGWIILENDSVEEAFRKLSELTPQWYATYRETIDANYAAALQYVDFYTNVSKVLQTCQ